MSTSIAKTDQPSSYLAIAFNNGLNYFILIALIGFALVSGRWWLLLAGGLGEALWLWSAPLIPPVRRSFDRRRRAERRRLDERRQRELLRTVGEDDRRRYLEIERLGREIAKLTRANPTLALDVGAGGQLGKLERLIQAFLRIAASAARYEAYVESTDLGSLEGEVSRQRTIIHKTAEGGPQQLARKNLELLEKRLAKATEIRRQVRTSRAQLNLIDNTVRLLRDQIVTMESPEELQDQLDELVSSIDAIDASAKETDALMLRFDSDLARREPK